MPIVTNQATIEALQANWVWIPDWSDSPPSPRATDNGTAGHVVRFTRSFNIPSVPPKHTSLHFSADTRYKLYVNGIRVAVGPARSSPLIWYYDTVDLGPYLRAGDNEIVFLVLRYFVTVRGAMPFARTPFPGLTVIGAVEAGLSSHSATIDLSSAGSQWLAQVDEGIRFPTGLVDDGFLHISERISPTELGSPVAPVAYNIRTVNGELSPWHLRPRAIPMPEETPIGVNTIRKCQSSISADEWAAYFAGTARLTLAAGSEHSLDVQADVHSTAFLRWTFRAVETLNTRAGSQIHLKVMYSEGYEHEPRNYPFFRSKSDRLNAENGYIIGPFDDVRFDLPATGSAVTYEPFWFRTLRVMRLHVTVTGPTPVQLLEFSATQVNYPMAIKASWHQPAIPDSRAMWDVSIRTMRNCMFDGYSDCPFYEQLQYSGDSRSVGLFHYLLSGDDRLMRQAISSFATSVHAEGLTQSRFPSHVPQIIAGFPLYWVLQVCDHHLYFGDTAYARSFLPRIDGVLDFFDQHVDEKGLVSGLPADVWQYVDWVTTWGATADHPDKGVPTAGRASNCHTFFSMLYAYVLRQAAGLTRNVGRAGYAPEYEARADAVASAVRQHCFDGRFFTDCPTDALVDLDVHQPTAYSQHCQVFGVLSGACAENDRERLLTESFSADARRFSKCSYVMQFYTLRAFSLAGDQAYESFLWPRVWEPWRKMLANNLSTWEEDDVRQRSDCHAWGSVPIYEYCTELAGVQPVAAGATKIQFKPRLRLADQLEAKICVGPDNVATVVWKVDDDVGYGTDQTDNGVKQSGKMLVELRLEKSANVVSILPGGRETHHGTTKHILLKWDIGTQ